MNNNVFLTAELREVQLGSLKIQVEEMTWSKAIKAVAIFQDINFKLIAWSEAKKLPIVELLSKLKYGKKHLKRRLKLCLFIIKPKFSNIKKWLEYKFKWKKYVKKLTTNQLAKFIETSLEPICGSDVKKKAAEMIKEMGGLQSTKQ